MEFNAYGISFTVPDEWIYESDFIYYSSKSLHYEYDNTKDIFLIDISTIYPHIRNVDVPIFNNCTFGDLNKSAKERTISILSAIKSRIPLPPVEVVDLHNNDNYKYKLINGCHRFHCSIIAGFHKIPAVYGFDIYSHHN